MNIGQAVLFIVIAAVAGYVFGMLDSRFTAALRKKTEKPAPESKTVMVEHNRPGEHTVLEVTLDQASAWHLELDGSRLDDPAAIPPDKHQRLVNTIMQIRPWLDGKPAPTAQSVASKPASTPVAIPPVEKMDAPLPSVKSSTFAEALKVSPMSGFSSMLVSEARLSAIQKPASIVSMIDAVLQTRLAGSPLRDKGIRLEDNPSGGVTVWIGIQHYSGIEAVPDPEVRAAIKAAVAEWDKNR